MNGPSQALSKSKHLLTPSSAYYDSLLKRCTATRSLQTTQQLHAHGVTAGVLSNYILSTLSAAYALCGCAPHARKLFDEFPERSLFSWNAMIRMYSSSGKPHDALQLFAEMLASGQHQPDKFMYPLVVKACGDALLLDVGVSVHARTLVSGFDSDTFVQNSLLAMYMNCGEMEAARQVFDTMWERTVVSWNTMINGYFRNGRAKEALVVFNWMKSVGVEPDSVTVVSILPVCGYLQELDVGRRIHAFVEEKGLGGRIPVTNSLVDMYAKCGSMSEAQLILDKMDEGDVVTWTTVINGYILNGDLRSALLLCPLMQLEGIRPNSVTVASLLSACASLRAPKHGRCLHGWAIKQKIETDVIVETALIDMYAKCSHVNLSFQVFMGTSKMRTVPWNAVLSGYIHNGLAREAIELFKQMLVESVDPNAATLNSLLPAYAILADMQQATNMHNYLIRSGFISSIEIATALIDIYSKCGNLEFAHKIFNGIPKTDKDIFLWSVIIASYGTHGNGKIAVSLFHDMVQSGVKPNAVTFTSVLHACSHAGLVDDGLSLFNLMLKDEQTHPHFDHYTCIIDLLGRAGRLDEAYGLIKTMPIKPNHAIWGALLGACVIHENVELGEVAANRLFKLEPENTGNYVLMAKIYAATGRWREAENVRHMMNEIGLRKAPAHSLIEVKKL
ncbi:pentatricopeptide repeat-containing protein At5g39350-like [Malania oleifera]|uniref:pentatricopeptide repeat-containing protein At5g39350-like n=1 Tax=Malania oleifera TaxID=397392 RepID=UPI0025ADB6A8|nr:pentatricopeptide repeat-containing protein At5g39350-like [Malania oleifera]